MFDGFSYNDIKNLSDLVSVSNIYNKQPQQEGDGNQFYSGELGKSVLNPGNIDGREKKEVARPFAKIEAKVNNRIIKNKETEIFTEEDIKEKDVLVEDSRPKPKFEVLYKQRVGTEDIYLGMSGKDVSSNCCDELVVKISLPGAQLKEIALDVKDQSIHLQVRKLSFI